MRRTTQSGQPCPACGAQCSPYARFCSKCGERVQIDSESAEPRNGPFGKLRRKILFASLFLFAMVVFAIAVRCAPRGTVGQPLGGKTGEKQGQTGVNPKTETRKLGTLFIKWEGVPSEQSNVY